VTSGYFFYFLLFQKQLLLKFIDELRYIDRSAKIDRETLGREMEKLRGLLNGEIKSLQIIPKQTEPSLLSRLNSRPEIKDDNNNDNNNKYTLIQFSEIFTHDNFCYFIAPKEDVINFKSIFLFKLKQF
jgi:hypothetical protein